MSRVVVEMPKHPIPGKSHEAGGEVFNGFGGRVVIHAVIVTMGGGNEGDDSVREVMFGDLYGNRSYVGWGKEL